MPAEVLSEMPLGIASVILRLRNEVCVGNLHFELIRLYTVVPVLGLYSLKQEDGIK